MSQAAGLKLDHRPEADVSCRTLQNPREGGARGGSQHMCQCIVISPDCFWPFSSTRKTFLSLFFSAFCAEASVLGSRPRQRHRLFGEFIFLLFTHHIKSCLLFRRLFKAASIDPHVTFSVGLSFSHREVGHGLVCGRGGCVWRAASTRRLPTAGELPVSGMDVRFIRGRKPCRLCRTSPFVGVTLIVIT